MQRKRYLNEMAIWLKILGAFEVFRILLGAAGRTFQKFLFICLFVYFGEPQ